MPALTVLGCRRPYTVLAVSFSMKLYTILGSLVLLLSLLDMRTTACMRLPVCGSTHILMDTACKIQRNESPWSPLLKVAFRLKNDCRAPLTLVDIKISKTVNTL
jgi:hypothetical protein